MKREREREREKEREVERGNEREKDRDIGVVKRIPIVVTSTCTMIHTKL